MCFHLRLCSPLVWAQAAVRRRQERLQVWGEFIHLHGKGGEAIVQQIILWLRICGVTQASQVSCCTNVTLGFMSISSSGNGECLTIWLHLHLTSPPLKQSYINTLNTSRPNSRGNTSLVCGDHGLTWLPDTFRSGQSVTEDAFVPQTSKPVYDAPALVQHRPLHLVLVCIWAPVTRLYDKTQTCQWKFRKDTRHVELNTAGSLDSP